jgi:hypothetical protein
MVRFLRAGLVAAIYQIFAVVIVTVLAAVCDHAQRSSAPYLFPVNVVALHESAFDAKQTR